MQEKQKKEQTLLFGMKNKLTFATQKPKKGMQIAKIDQLVEHDLALEFKNGFRPWQGKT